MKIVTETATHEIVAYEQGEQAPLGYQQGDGKCYRVTEGSDPGLRYRLRVPLLPNTQLKVWQGLIEPQVVADLLADDPVTTSVPLNGTVRDAAKVTLACGLVGVHKPAASDDEWTGLHWAEIAAYQVDRAIGLDCVPVTVLRQQPVAGSIQLWVDGLTHLATAPPEVLLFDRLIANSDRGNENSPNFKAHPHAPRHCVAFDNGCSFTATVLDGKQGVEAPDPTLVARLTTLKVDDLYGLPPQSRVDLADRVKKLHVLFTA
ncbi:hypothetical protein [Micromonospora palythoicola]|uniref:hypothetical protein n=1 Tax=Micromonospora palythoicola TaxID=3120507 RepID=UPI002FCE60A3